MSEQPALFATTQEIRAAEDAARRAAYLDARRVDGGWQCQSCGGIESNTFLFSNNHGGLGGRCLRVFLRRNHALYALRHGELDRWASATVDLCEVAAWRAGRAAR